MSTWSSRSRAGATAVRLRQSPGGRTVDLLTTVATPTLTGPDDRIQRLVPHVEDHRNAGADLGKAQHATEP